jgi:hypothetical protein
MLTSWVGTLGSRVQRCHPENTRHDHTDFIGEQALCREADVRDLQEPECENEHER